MVNTIISLPGYAYLYRSLLRFYEMPENHIKELLYELNEANLDCYSYYHPMAWIVESGPVYFNHYLESRQCRPYRTEVQLYKSLLCLKRSIDYEILITSQREALQELRLILSNLEYRFYKAYKMEFEDKRTVYEACVYHTIPQENEPNVCLMCDWTHRPSA